jgi:hypothetical protein
MKNIAAKPGLKAGLIASAAALSIVSAVPARADGVPQQEILNNVITNLLQNIRDQIQMRKLVVSPLMRFSGEDGEFDNHDPFAAQGSGNPFGALAYAKAPAMAPAAAPTWIYGANLIGSGDRSYGFGTTTSLATVVGAFDATKIGVFTATDAVSFVVTGADTWAHTAISPAGTLNSSTPSGSGTIAYVNGGFSTDLTTSASWTSNSGAFFIAPPANSSSLAYTWNAQYRFDFPYTVFMEPRAA